MEEINREVNAVFETFDPARKQLFEVHEQTILRLVFDKLCLKFSISIPEIERIIWKNDANIVGVKGAAELLDCLDSWGIRTGVISNLDFSGYLLEDRLRRIYPNHCFEFVIASSDYGVRKPNPYLFEVGIQKSGLSPEEIWYVGDKLRVDVNGSRNSGMVPLLYKSEYNRYGEIPSEIPVVEDYSQMISLLCE